VFEINNKLLLLLTLITAILSDHGIEITSIFLGQFLTSYCREHSIVAQSFTMRSLLLILTLFSVILATYAASFGQQSFSDEYDPYDIPDNLKLCGDKNDILQ
jgi:hypothetical protein